MRPYACLSLQTLSEFAAVALRNGMDPVTCRVIVAEYRRSWTILVPTPNTLGSAVAGVAQHRLTFWDAMLWAVASEQGLTEILTEDGPDNAVIGGVRYRNPFQYLQDLLT